MGDIITKDWELFKYQSEDGTFHELYVKRINGKDHYHLDNWCKLLDIKNSRDAATRLDPDDVVLTDSRLKKYDKRLNKEYFTKRKILFCTREGLLDLIMDTGKYELSGNQASFLDILKAGSIQ